MRIYSTHQWRRDRKQWQRTQPTCVDCGQPADQWDHVPPRRILVAAGIHDPDHPRWRRDRCASCHSAKTATFDMALLARLDQGEDAHTLAEEAMQHEMAWHNIGVAGIN